MLYLVTQMWVCLILAFLLGLLLGLFLKKGCKKNCKYCKNKSNNHQDEPEQNNSVHGLTSNIAEKPSRIAAAVSMRQEITDLDTLVDLDGEDYAIETLEGIGPKTGELFRSIGIATVGDVLRKAHSQVLRDDLAKKLEIKVEPLNDWAGMSDLLRIKGVDHQSAELAYATGTQHIEQLSHWDSASFVEAMNIKNNSGPQLIAPTVPSVEQVSDWIIQAANMKSIVSY